MCGTNDSYMYEPELSIPALAYEASISMGYGNFGVLPERKMERAKNEIWRWGRGRKETLADKPLSFENLCSPANGARDWLG